MKLHIPAGLANKLAKPAAKVKTASPEILLGVGLASIGVGVVWACKNTLHIDDVLDTHEHRMNKVEEGLKRFDRKTYSEQDAKKDKVQIFTKTAVDLVKLYAVPTLLIAGGVACILCSHNVMSKRNAALLESANIANAALDAYQKRVAPSRWTRSRRVTKLQPSSIRTGRSSMTRTATGLAPSTRIAFSCAVRNGTRTTCFELAGISS